MNAGAGAGAGSLEPVNIDLLKARPDAACVDPVYLELELRRDAAPGDSNRLCRSFFALLQRICSFSAERIGARAVPRR